MKILAIGLNYKDHVMESGLSTPQNPFLFNKTPTSIIGAGNWGQSNIKYAYLAHLMLL